MVKTPPKYSYHITVTNADTGEVVVDREFTKLNWMYQYLDSYTNLTHYGKIAFLKNVKLGGSGRISKSYRSYIFYNVEATRTVL